MLNNVLERAKLEKEFIDRVPHRHVVKSYGSSMDDKGQHYIRFEYCNEGNMKYWIDRHKDKGDYNILLTIKWMKEICQAIGMMHANHLMHRDIKPQNMIVHREESGELIVKLADFGEARNTAAKTVKTSVGTEYYLAPEVDGKSYDSKADCYSLGVTFFFMLDGQLPWKTKGAYRRGDWRKEKKTASSDKAGQFVEDLFERCLQEDPKNRPSCKEMEAECDAWIAKLRAEEKEAEQAANQK